jgi:hypothetical protein
MILIHFIELSSLDQISGTIIWWPQNCLRITPITPREKLLKLPKVFTAKPNYDVEAKIRRFQSDQLPV